MRVLHVVASGRRRGAEVFASDLAGALAQQGVVQRVAVLRASEGHAVSYAVPVTSLNGKGMRVPGLRMDSRTLGALRGLIGGWKPDVIQAHGGEPLKYSVAVALGRRRPLVYRRIGSVIEELARGPRRTAYGSLMRRAARVVAVADVLRKETIEVFRVSADRVVTIPNGVDPERLEPTMGRHEIRRSIGIAPSAPVVLSLGALVWEKDPMLQLDVAARLLRADPDLVVLMAGDGEMREAVEAAVRDRGLTGRILLLGARSDVADLLAASDALLFASKSEGMAGTVIEAGMAGVPVAAFSVGGVPEVIQDGVTGLLAPPGDVDSLAGHIMELLHDPAAREAMGRNARGTYRARFGIKAIAPQYLALYEELLEAP
ncbi:MAG: glycosyltransferase family 4 protein [Actinomycetota bacterium]